MSENGSDLHRAVILTAIRVEYEAVRAHLTDLREEPHPQGTIYERGIFSNTNQDWDVIIGEIGAGNPTAALEAEWVYQLLPTCRYSFRWCCRWTQRCEAGRCCSCDKNIWILIREG